MKFFIKSLGLVLGLFMLLFVSYGIYFYFQIGETVEDMHYEIEREPKRPTLATIESEDPISFLILGIDSKESEKGRSDVNIVVTVNPNTNSIKMLTIPRDTRTMIVGKGFEDKINHAYAFGGPEMSIATVEEFLDIPIDHFASINMAGFKDMVDAVGGVTVQNNLYFTQDHHTFNKGTVHLNGEKALAYVRHRKTDPKGDLGRAERQKQVIQAVINKVTSSGSITMVKDILQVLGTNVKTDLTYKQMTTFLMKYSDTQENIESLTVKGSGSKINRVYYYLVSDEEKQRVSKELREHLELEGTNLK